MMIFRHTPVPGMELSPEELQTTLRLWQDWIAGIVAQGKFVSTNQLGFEGKTLKPGQVITDGPYAEVKEIIGGNMVVRADNIDEVMRMAEGCPILARGGNVEVRDIMKLN